ncbi:MAG: MFS transporter [Fidelibacterota bacterium]
MWNRNVTTLWLAQLISYMGDAVYQLALIWLIFDITDSSVVTGIVAMSAYLPAIIFGLLGGVFADKYNRLRIMHIANVSQSLTVIIIPITLYYGVADAMLLGLLAFVRSSFGTLFPPALNAFIPEVVDKKGLTKVNSINATSMQLAYLLGPAVAGVLLGIISVSKLFIFDAFSFLGASFLLLFVVKKRKPPLRESHATFSQLKSGFIYIIQHRSIGYLILLTILNNIFIMGPAIVGMPILVKSVLDGTASDFAFVEAGMAGGMLMGSWFVYRFSHRFNNGLLLLIGLLWDGITYTFFYWVPSVPVAIVMIVIHGIGIPVITITRTAIIQRNTPNEYHGRLFSMVHLAIVGMTALSSALVGILASLMPVPVVFLIFGIGAFVSGLIGLMSSKLRRLN